MSQASDVRGGGGKYKKEKERINDVKTERPYNRMKVIFIKKK